MIRVLRYNSSYDVKTTSHDFATGYDAELMIKKQNWCSIVFPLQHSSNRRDATPALCVKGCIWTYMFMVSVHSVYAASAGGWYDPCLGGWRGAGPLLKMWFHYTSPPLSLYGPIRARKSYLLAKTITNNYHPSSIIQWCPLHCPLRINIHDATSS